jgi:hypothetical protein
LRNSVPIRPSENRKDEEETDPSRSEEAILVKEDTQRSRPNPDGVAARVQLSRHGDLTKETTAWTASPISPIPPSRQRETCVPSRQRASCGPIEPLTRHARDASSGRLRSRSAPSRERRDTYRIEERVPALSRRRPRGHKTTRRYMHLAGVVSRRGRGARATTTRPWGRKFYPSERT